MNEIVQRTKSYWSRPEGKTGMLLIGGGVAALLYGWGTIVPFLVSMVANTLMLGLLTAGLIVFLMIAFSPRTHMMFRLITRWITGLVIQLDPIGILKDRVAQLMKRLEEFGEQKANLRGATRILKDTREKNEEAIQQQRKVVANAKSLMERPGGDASNLLRAQTEFRVAMNEIARLETANKKYTQLLSVLERVHEKLDRLSVYLDGYVRDAQNEARQQEIQRKATRSASKAISTAMRILRGSATESDIYNTTLEHLADEASQRLGEIDEGLRFAEEFMTKVDLQSGVVSDDAFKMLDEFETKLALPPARMSLVEVPTAKKDNANEYARLIGRKE